MPREQNRRCDWRLTLMIKVRLLSGYSLYRNQVFNVLLVCTMYTGIIIQIKQLLIF